MRGLRVKLTMKSEKPSSRVHSYSTHKIKANGKTQTDVKETPPTKFGKTQTHVKVVGSAISARGQLHTVMDLIRTKLSKKNLVAFRKTCFGHLLDIPQIQFLGQLIYLLLNALRFQTNDRSTMWFDINNTVIEFGPLEFFCITGLSFNEVHHAPLTTSEMHRRIFQSRDEMKAIDVEEAFLHYSRVHKGRGKYVLHLALLWVVYGLLTNRDQYYKNINIDYMHLVDDLEVFNKYPWGSVAYDFLANWTHVAAGNVDRRKFELKRSSTDVCGFTVALQIWAFEVMPELASQVATQLNNTSFPRLMRWSTDSYFRCIYLSKFFQSSSPSSVALFTLSDEEKTKSKDAGVPQEAKKPVKKRPRHDDIGIEPCNELQPTKVVRCGSLKPTVAEFLMRRSPMGHAPSGTSKKRTPTELLSKLRDESITMELLASQISGLHSMLSEGFQRLGMIEEFVHDMCRNGKKTATRSDSNDKEHGDNYSVPVRGISIPKFVALVKKEGDFKEGQKGESQQPGDTIKRSICESDNGGDEVNKEIEVNRITRVNIVDSIREDNYDNCVTDSCLGEKIHEEIGVDVNEKGSLAGGDSLKKDQLENEGDKTWLGSPVQEEVKDLTMVLYCLDAPDNEMVMPPVPFLSISPEYCQFDIADEGAMENATGSNERTQRRLFEDIEVVSHIEKSVKASLKSNWLKGKHLLNQLMTDSFVVNREYTWDFIKQFNTWYRARCQQEECPKTRLPVQHLQFAEASWFNRIFQYHGWLGDDHCDVLINLVVLHSQYFPRDFMDDWTIIESIGSDALASMNFTCIYDRVANYASGTYPSQRGKAWKTVEKVYGIANVTENHWVLYMLSLPHQSIVVFDSLVGPGSWECIEDAFQHMRRNLPLVCADHEVVFAGPKCDLWGLVSYDQAPQQTNAYDCGIMCIKMLECLTIGSSFATIDPRRCLQYRQSYCAELYMMGQAYI